ncbi:MAG: nucleoside 2-deoxyribosyltransferase [Syntrophobacteraceae bacterium]|nr:nucleoside 2-deoxyribosyltransferase [Syntrophobacteraceae bacterium]
MKVYLAGPLFTQSQRDWLRKLKNDLEILTASRNCPVNVIWPYELITPAEIDSLGKQARQEIFSRCKSHLDDADVLIALLDGPQVDDGTAWEIGYFYAKRGPGQNIMGIRTDFRQAGESEGAVVNAMIEMACDRVVRSGEALLESWAEWFRGISA